ncbi:MAG TPA: hypothetical protein VJH34_04015 [archaeon]|nr:hypothetical protein [archaeon]
MFKFKLSRKLEFLIVAGVIVAAVFSVVNFTMLNQNGDQLNQIVGGLGFPTKVTSPTNINSPTNSPTLTDCRTTGCQPTCATNSTGSCIQYTSSCSISTLQSASGPVYQCNTQYSNTYPSNFVCQSDGTCK